MCLSVHVYSSGLIGLGRKSLLPPMYFMFNFTLVSTQENLMFTFNYEMDSNYVTI